MQGKSQQEIKKIIIILFIVILKNSGNVLRNNREIIKNNKETRDSKGKIIF